MKTIKKTTLIGGAVAGALLLSSQAFAAPVSLDGINFSTGASFQVGDIYENVASNVGDELSGYGRINSINGSTNFCAGGPGSCELTFAFDGYTAKSFSADGSQASFSGGNVNFYADTSTNFDGNGGSLATASDGSLFLSTVGHTFQDSTTGRTGTLLSQGANLNTNQPQGTGVGQLDVTGGDGAAYFNTDTQDDFLGGTSDLLINSSFAATGCPANGQPLCGSGDLHGNAQAVPEPSQLGIMGLSLFAFGFLAKRKRRSA